MGRVEVNDNASELSDLEVGSSTQSASPDTISFRTRYGLVRPKAYIFGEVGEYCDKELDILKLQDILSLVIYGPYCAHVDVALVFRVNSPGLPSSKFTFRLAEKITENSVITVSLGRVPRFSFSPVCHSLLYGFASPKSKFGREETANMFLISC
ncbi:hypothetical protein Tco_0827004 [Tanacetum coccineum]